VITHPTSLTLSFAPLNKILNCTNVLKKNSVDHLETRYWNAICYASVWTSFSESWLSNWWLLWQPENSRWPPKLTKNHNFPLFRPSVGFGHQIFQVKWKWNKLRFGSTWKRYQYMRTYVQASIFWYSMLTYSQELEFVQRVKATIPSCKTLCLPHTGLKPYYSRRLITWMLLNFWPILWGLELSRLKVPKR
jgi:hypothetical protein